jgi:hypothetical protein
MMLMNDRMEEANANMDGRQSKVAMLLIVTTAQTKQISCCKLCCLIAIVNTRQEGFIVDCFLCC